LLLTAAVGDQHEHLYAFLLATGLRPGEALALRRQDVDVDKRRLLPTTHRLHDLRYCAATYLLAAGVDRQILMHMMGWSQVRMLTRYQHVLDPMLDEAAARLEAVFPAASAAR